MIPTYQTTDARICSGTYPPHGVTNSSPILKLFALKSGKKCDIEGGTSPPPPRPKLSQNFSYRVVICLSIEDVVHGICAEQLARRVAVCFLDSIVALCTAMLAVECVRQGVVCIN